jgi:hypothetical protein
MKKIKSILRAISEFFCRFMFLFLATHFVVINIWYPTPLHFALSILALLSYIDVERKHQRRTRQKEIWNDWRPIFAHKKKLTLIPYKPTKLTAFICITCVILGAAFIAMAIESYNIWLSSLFVFISFISYFSILLEIRNEKKWQKENHKYEERKAILAKIDKETEKLEWEMKIWVAKAKATMEEEKHGDKSNQKTNMGVEPFNAPGST